MAWRPLGFLLFLRGRHGQYIPPRGSDVRPSVPWVSNFFVRQAWDDVHYQCVAYTVQPGIPQVSAAFAWREWDNVHCQGPMEGKKQLYLQSYFIRGPGLEDLS